MKYKKIIAQLLTATMCLSVLPVSAMPAYVETAEPQNSSDENISVVSEDCADPAEPQTNLTSESTESDLTSPTAEIDDHTGLTNEETAATSCSGPIIRLPGTTIPHSLSKTTGTEHYTDMRC